MKPTILSIVPARGGSKGVPRKNLLHLSGKPLIQWTIEEAQKSKYLDRVVVSTEDVEIEGVSRSLGAEVVKRPIELAGDDSPTIGAVVHVLEELRTTENYVPDLIMLLQCTSPLRKAWDIDDAVESFLQRPDANSLISVCVQEHPPWWLKRIDEDGYLEDFIDYDKEKYSRRQSFPPTYRLNGAIYLGRTSEVLRYNSFQTDKTVAYVMDSYSSVDIDTKDDFQYAEFIMKEQ